MTNVETPPVGLVGESTMRTFPAPTVIDLGAQTVIAALRERGRYGAGIDVALVVDTTGSMGVGISRVQAFGAEFMSLLTDINPTSRVGVVEYKDQGDVYVTRVNAPLSDDSAVVQAGLDMLAANGGGDFPEDVFEGLRIAFNLSWGQGTSRVIILIGDARPHEFSEVNNF